MQVLSHKRFEVRDDLTIERTRIVQRVAEHRDLKEQLERHARGPQVDYLRATIAQVLADEITVPRQAPMSLPQASIDAGVLESAEDSARERRYRKEIQNRAVIQINGWFFAPLRFGVRLPLGQKIRVNGKGIAVVLFRWIVQLGERSESSAQIA